MSYLIICQLSNLRGNNENSNHSQSNDEKLRAGLIVIGLFQCKSHFDIQSLNLVYPLVAANRCFPLQIKRFQLFVLGFSTPTSS